MSRFAIEHLPRTAASYRVSPIDYAEARTWLALGDITSLIRTTELIDAIETGLGVRLEQAPTPMALRPGDQAVLISLSFSVMLAWASGQIAPLEEDWRCLLLTVEEPSPVGAPVLLTELAEE